MNATLNPVLHELVSALSLVRDRLRCPKCGSIGTWKPHGARFDRDDIRRVRRWLCKWCGHYVGPEGVRRAVVCAAKKVWSLPEDALDNIGTPQHALRHTRHAHTWPWRG